LIVCGRFTLRTPINLLAERFMVQTPLLDVHPRYNIAPTQDALVVRAHDGKREATMLRWGLTPSWAKDTKIAASLINARSETVAEKQPFDRRSRSGAAWCPSMDTTNGSAKGT
jgi:putative SOS response-associated peptidase YedK